MGHGILIADRTAEVVVQRTLLDLEALVVLAQLIAQHARDELVVGLAHTLAADLGIVSEAEAVRVPAVPLAAHAMVQRLRQQAVSAPPADVAVEFGAAGDHRAEGLIAIL